MTNAVGAVSPQIKVNGRPMQSGILDQLTSVRVERGLNMPGRTQLRFDDPGYLVSTSAGFGPGTDVSISVGETVIFLGEVTGVELEHRQRSVDLLVTVDDAAFKFGLGTKVRTFANVTASDVVRQLATEHGLQCDADSTASAFPYLIQSTSDLHFLNDLADRAGFDWTVNQRRLSFGEPKMGTPVSLALGADLIQFTVRTTSLHPSETTVTGWGVKTKQGIAGTAKVATATLKPDAAFVEGFLTAAQTQNVSKVANATSIPMDQGEANAVARSKAQRWASQAVTAKGTCLANPAIVPGCAVKVGQAGPGSGTYYVTRVEHIYSNQGFVTRFTAGDRRPSSLVETLGGAGPSSLGSGLIVGVVTALGDAQSLAPGSVKVKYVSVDDALESNWARVVTVGGGTGRGLTFLPEINDEVLVGFEAGDLRRPLVLGGLYNGKDIPKDFGVKQGTINSRQITSRLGHAVEFRDGTAPEDQLIGLTLAGGAHMVSLSKKSLEAKVPAGIPINIQSGSASIKISDTGEITIAGRKIVLKADTDVEVSGLNVTLKASVKLAASATALELKANAQAELSAGGPTMVKGATVMIN